MTVDDEREWWDSLEGQAVVDNTVGRPPYDVDEVADFLELVLLCGDPLNGVLDLGCGFGRLTHSMALRNPDWFFEGVDISPRLINMAERTRSYRERYLVGDGRSIPVDPGIGAAYSVTVFQHLPAAAVRNYIRQVHDLLVPAGRFAFTWIGGSEEAFLSHQVSRDLVDDWVRAAGFATWIHLVVPDHTPGWNWVVATKGSDR